MSLTKEVSSKWSEARSGSCPTLVGRSAVPFSPDESSISRSVCGRIRRITVWRRLLKLVGQRRRFLNYMQRKDIEGYRVLIKELGLRR